MNPLSPDQSAPVNQRGYAVVVQGLAATISVVALAIIALQPLSSMGLIILGGVAGVSITTFIVASYFALRKQPETQAAEPLQSQETDEETPSIALPITPQDNASVHEAEQSIPVEASISEILKEDSSEIATAKEAVNQLFSTLEKTAKSLLTNPRLGISESDRHKQEAALTQLIANSKELLYPYIDKKHVCESKPLLRLQIMAAWNAGQTDKMQALIAEFKGERQDIEDQNARILGIMKGGILKAQISLENFKMLIESGNYDKATLAKAYAMYDINELRMFCINVLMEASEEAKSEALNVFTAQMSSRTECVLLKNPSEGEAFPTDFATIFGVKSAALPEGYSSDVWTAFQCELDIKAGSGLKKLPLPKPSMAMRVLLSVVKGMIPTLLAKAFVKHGFKQGPLAEKNEKQVANNICTNISNLLGPFMSPLYGKDDGFRTLLKKLVAQNETVFKELAQKISSAEELTFETFTDAANAMTATLQASLEEQQPE